MLARDKKLRTELLKGFSKQPLWVHIKELQVRSFTSSLVWTRAFSTSSLVWTPNDPAPDSSAWPELLSAV
eukprot:1196334-Prorocentrum_minimum.AAC.3